MPNARTLVCNERYKILERSQNKDLDAGVQPAVVQSKGTSAFATLDQAPSAAPPLSAYSRARFLDAASGALSAVEYVEEVVAHVEAQLPRRQGVLQP